MSIYQSSYLLVCEGGEFFGSGIGCGAELHLSPVRGHAEAVSKAKAEGWRVNPPSSWDDDRGYFTLCPDCSARLDIRLADLQSRKAEAQP